MGADEFKQWIAYSCVEPIFPHSTGDGEPEKKRQTETEMKTNLMVAFGGSRGVK